MTTELDIRELAHANEQRDQALAEIERLKNLSVAPKLALIDRDTVEALYAAAVHGDLTRLTQDNARRLCWMLDELVRRRAVSQSRSCDCTLDQVAEVRRG